MDATGFLPGERETLDGMIAGDDPINRYSATLLLEMIPVFRLKCAKPLNDAIRAKETSLDAAKGVADMLGYFLAMMAMAVGGGSEWSHVNVCSMSERAHDNAHARVIATIGTAEPDLNFMHAQGTA